MKKDVHKKRPAFRVSSKYVRDHLLELLKLTEDLETIYQTYPKLQIFVGHQAWQQLTDVPYRQLLDLNLQPNRKELRDGFAKNILHLEDLAASTLIRDRTAFRDTLSRILRFRIQNGLAAERRK
jgi:hypothetical protein